LTSLPPRSQSSPDSQRRDPLNKRPDVFDPLDVARVLLHGTKTMVALPGRQCDMKGIGGQQEGWQMDPGGPGRGVGRHRFWLPWISANHLYGITGLEEFDPALYKQLIKDN
jgi:hypothetical protein